MTSRKQSITHDDFAAILAATPATVPRADFDARFARTVDEVRAVTRGRTVGYAWSGGKDSIALELVMDAAGVTACCLGRTDLEYDAFIDWLGRHAPRGLCVYNNHWDLTWVRRHPAMLFPCDYDRTACAAVNVVRLRWFAGNQLAAQTRFVRDHHLDLLITGKRAADGNVIRGDQTSRRYVSGGVERYAPIWDWSHADVFAALLYRDRLATLPPFYTMPRGWRVGTHAWAGRRVQRPEQGWAECYAAEPARVADAAAANLPGARAWLEAQR